MVTGKPCKSTLYFGFSCSYLQNKVVDLIVNPGTGYETLKPSKARTMLSPGNNNKDMFKFKKKIKKNVSQSIVN